MFDTLAQAHGNDRSSQVTSPNLFNWKILRYVTRCLVYMKVRKTTALKRIRVPGSVIRLTANPDDRKISIACPAGDLLQDYGCNIA
jgi:hypothetical protein